MRISDWSSDVCSSDLDLAIALVVAGEADAAGRRRDDLASGACDDGDAARAHPAFVHLAQPRDDSPDDGQAIGAAYRPHGLGDRRSEEHTSELQSLMRISYAVFCLKKKIKKEKQTHDYQTRQKVVTTNHNT